MILASECHMNLSKGMLGPQGAVRNYQPHATRGIGIVTLPLNNDSVCNKIAPNHH